MYIQLPSSPFPKRLGKELLRRDKTRGAGKSHPRAFCSPHLGLGNAAKCSTSPPTATLLRTWGFFCYFFVAVRWIWVCFKNAQQSLRDSWGYFHLLRNFSLCPPSGTLAHQETAFLLSFLTLSLTLLIEEEWKAAQSKPAMSRYKNSVTNHALFPVAGKLTCACRRDYKQKKNEAFGQMLGGR